MAPSQGGAQTHQMYDRTYLANVKPQSQASHRSSIPSSAIRLS